MDKIRADKSRRAGDKAFHPAVVTARYHSRQSDWGFEPWIALCDYVSQRQLRHRVGHDILGGVMRRILGVGFMFAWVAVSPAQQLSFSAIPYVNPNG
ncbi:uncharacterized protein METZ01_LOCUS262668, partial [marine metagenome]